MQKKVLVTGATGLVGGHLVYHLLESGAEVYATRRASSSLVLLRYILGFYTTDIEGVISRIEWVEADIREVDQLTVAMRGIDVVYHCAADVALGGALQEDVYRTNIEGSRNIAQAVMCSGVKKVLYVSSIAVLGDEASSGEIDELSEWNPNAFHSVYALSKRAAAEEVESLSRYGVEVASVLPGPILGASNRNEGSSKITFLARKGYPFYTHGGSGYVDVRDVCRVLLQLSETKLAGERYVLVGANVTTHYLLTLFSKGFHTLKPMIAVPNWLFFGVAIALDKLYALIGKKSFLDKDIAMATLSEKRYSSRKIINKLDFKFTPIEQTVTDITSYFVQQESK